MDEQVFRSVVVVAPHLDDETLGLGGTIAKLITCKKRLTILLVSELEALEIEQTINNLKERLPGVEFVRLRYGPSTLTMDTLPILVEKIKAVIDQVDCTALFVPYWDDAHSDHYIVSNASIAAAKSFRSQSVKLVAAYEVPSETEFAFRSAFIPNLFIDISEHIIEKEKLLGLHQSEIVNGPLPRQIGNVLALAKYRGGRVGSDYAEAFQIVMWKL